LALKRGVSSGVLKKGKGDYQVKGLGNGLQHMNFNYHRRSCHSSSVREGNVLPAEGKVTAMVLEGEGGCSRFQK
jgi:hypothetical protein